MLCADPFKNIFITTSKENKLAIAPCCNAENWEVDTTDFINDPILNEIRDAMLKGEKHLRCQRCWSAESTGVKSRREQSNEWASAWGFFDNKIELKRVDYWIGNTCNLACVICDPYASSRWHADAALLGRNKNEMFMVTSTEYWKDIPDTVISVHFTGGEPLLSKDHNNFLDSIKNKDKVELIYNTNGTVKPSERTVELWNQFDKVILVLSFDDINQRLEYQRYPLDWNKFLDNLRYLKSLEKIKLETLTTIGLLNVFSFPEVYNWFLDFFNPSEENCHSVQYAHGVTNCQRMPAKFKSVMEELYKNMPDKFNFSKFIEFTNDDIDPKFFDYLERLDKIRNLDYKKVFPYLT